MSTLHTVGSGADPAGDAVGHAASPATFRGGCLDRVLTWLGCWTVLVAAIIVVLYPVLYVLGVSPDEAVSWVVRVGQTLAASAR